jgi:hypothetical protein
MKGTMKQIRKKLTAGETWISASVAEQFPQHVVLLFLWRHFNCDWGDASPQQAKSKRRTPCSQPTSDLSICRSGFEARGISTDQRGSVCEPLLAKSNQKACSLKAKTKRRFSNVFSSSFLPVEEKSPAVAMMIHQRPKRRYLTAGAAKPSPCHRHRSGRAKAPHGWDRGRAISRLSPIKQERSHVKSPHRAPPSQARYGRFDLVIEDDGNWYYGDADQGRIATKAQMEAVSRDFSALRLRGEYWDAPVADVGWLDDVYFGFERLRVGMVLPVLQQKF